MELAIALSTPRIAVSFHVEVSASTPREKCNHRAWKQATGEEGVYVGYRLWSPSSSSTVTLTQNDDQLDIMEVDAANLFHAAEQRTYSFSNLYAHRLQSPLLPILKLTRSASVWMSSPHTRHFRPILCIFSSASSAFKNSGVSDMASIVSEAKVSGRDVPETAGTY